MAILGVTSQSGRLFCPEDPATDLRLHLAQALRHVPKHAPIVIMIHGYKYHPAYPANDPHKLLYSSDPETHSSNSTSWPLGLGFQKLTHEDGLAIGFAWEGKPSTKILPKPRLSSFAHVYAQANRAGSHLGRLIDWIGELSPGRKIDIIAHSLGARVTFSGLLRAKNTNMGRIILMGGAEYKSVVERYFRHINRSPKLEVFCVRTRRNAFVDFLFETFAPRPHPTDTAIGRGYQGPRANWMNIRLDDPAMLTMLSTRGIGISPPTSMKLVDHWGFYNRAGILKFYQHLLRHRQSWRLSDMQQELAWDELIANTPEPDANLLTP